MHKISVFGTFREDHEEQLIAELSIHKVIAIDSDLKGHISRLFAKCNVEITSMRKQEVLEHEIA